MPVVSVPVSADAEVRCGWTRACIGSCPNLTWSRTCGRLLLRARLSLPACHRPACGANSHLNEQRRLFIFHHRGRGAQTGGSDYAPNVAGRRTDNVTSITGPDECDEGEDASARTHGDGHGDGRGGGGLPSAAMGKSRRATSLADFALLHHASSLARQQAGGGKSGAHRAKALRPLNATAPDGHIACHSATALLLCDASS